MYEREQRLERGELIALEQPPFALPGGDDRAFLLQQQPRTAARFIVLDPRTEEVTGHRGPEAQAPGG